MRRITMALLLLATGLAALLAAFLHAALSQPQRRAVMQANRELVAALGLTDPALFTEARYTRHLTQADLFTPFQDSPASFEHFPSGALVLPPPQIRKSKARLLKAPPSPPPGAGADSGQ
jgi:hypothetical protein